MTSLIARRTASDASSRGRLRRIPPAVFPPLLLLAVWFAVTPFTTPQSFAGPVATLQALWDGLSTGWLSEAIAVTLGRTLIGFMIASALGLAVAFSLGLRPFAGAVAAPIVLLVYALPKVVLFPVFLLAFNLSIWSYAWFGVLSGVFPLVYVVMTAVRDVPPSRLRMASIYRLSFWQTVRRVVAPSIRVHVLIGLRYCFSVTLLSVVIAELFASTQGVGNQLLAQISAIRPDRVFALAVAIAVVAVAVNVVFLVLARRMAGSEDDGGRPLL